ncbi:MAG TPA: choice-of-anchor J domain-containing protein [Candidatus Cloacimonadota bacterium]|jgi:hypothetical protein|nr:choice-of-anchor J domain-containing protein [Candidatus Cloacimonadota bacterium]HPL23954.1 choice-of-anchor J domain-containing protein [Candidatus Cloacimonadota bacterium]HRS74865.1 choice-of-anchor J domain-containing protein [Anaerolineaceae bacterium]
MKKLMLISIALLLIAGVYADVIIGTGTSTGRYPLNDFFKHSKSQCIYTAEEIGVPAGGTITHLRWYRNDTGANPSAIGTTEIWLTETTATTLSTWQPEGTLVATITDIDLGSGGGWFEVDITDFPYTGSNLMVSVRTQNAPYTLPHSTWRYTSTTPDYRSIMGNSDSANPPSVSTSYNRPNITLVGITQTIPPGVCNLVYPTPSGATGVGNTPTLSWAIGAGGVPTGYDVYFGETLPAEGSPNVDHTVQTATTWAPGTLSYSTTYSWKIVPWNAYGHPNYADCPTWTFTTMPDPVKPLDYSQDFDSGTLLSAIEWTGNMSISASHGNNGTNGLYKNLYSGVTTCNAVTPPIGPMTADCQIIFEYRIVNYTGYPGTGTTLGANDKIEVQISNDNGTNYTTIHTIDQNNHVTSNAFATVTVPVTAYNADIINVKFLCSRGAGDYYVDIDNVLVRETPQGGLLTVNPSPVECGNGYIGLDKAVQVSLTNTGVAAFDVTSITLADYTDFSLANLPTLPVTINPGAPAVTFDVVFTATVTGPLTTNLLINDTRQASSIVVNGTGVQPLVGEICENPYLATLPLVDFAGSTAGYANDYTEAMFTGLNTSGYVRGQDWVAKITIPSDGTLDISLANQTGYSNQWMGVFLVNTIPSLANPATVLAQGTSSSGTATITDAIVSAGDYYVIVDNWPTPDDIYFVLNMSFDSVTTPPNPATLVSPANGATSVPLTQTLNWSSGGGYLEGYRLSFGTVDPYAVIVNNVDLGMQTTYSPALNYSTEYWWTVTPYNTAYGDASPITTWSFTTMADPTKPLPYTQNFDSATSLTDIDWTGDMGISSEHGKDGTNGLYRNLYSYVTTCNAITPPIGPMTNGVELKFDYRIVNYTGYPNNATVLGANDNIQVQISTDSGTNYSTIHTINQANHVTSTSFATVTVPLTAYTTGNIMLKFQGNRGEGDYYVDFDNVIVRVAPTVPEAPILTYPADGATDLPKTGFNLTWQNNPQGMVPDYFKVFLWTDEQGEYGGPYWETADATVTSLNPAVVIPEGETVPLSFAYDERWNWTVAAVVGTVEEVAVSRWFTIQSDPTITNFPWDEDFEDGVFPPIGWTVSDVDGGGTYWTASNAQNHTTGGNTSAVHNYNSSVPAPGQDGWLITPPAAIPTSTYNVVLSWWNYNVYPTWLVYNGVKVNTTNDPADPNWVELWSQDSAASAWSNEVVNINAYQGQTVYFAFHYQGYNADDWFVDDVSIYELIVDLIPPTITHLPVINTPREDLQQLVMADIRDDATWNNLIGGANLYYSIDGGTTYSAAVNMVAYDDTTYYAYIPAQPLGTTVTYYMQAWDSENNIATTDEFSYGVNDPTWIWYDTGGTTYLGYTSTDYGPAVLFENPFYGTGNAMQLLATDGSSYYGNAANLQIWTYDGVNNLVPYFATPIPVTFGAQTYDTFDLSAHNVQITDPYFFVSYLDVPMGNYILFDTTYDYGTSFVFQGTTLYMMGNAGSWSIGAQVQTGISLGLDAPVVTIALTAGQPTLSWDAVTGANSYLVYGATDPYAADPWTLLDTVYTPGYTYTGTAAMEFFKVTASDATAPGRVTEQATPLKKTQTLNAPKIKLDNAPKGIVKTGLRK